MLSYLIASLNGKRLGPCNHLLLKLYCFILYCFKERRVQPGHYLLVNKYGISLIVFKEKAQPWPQSPPEKKVRYLLIYMCLSDCFGIGATIRTSPEIQWSPVYSI